MICPPGWNHLKFAWNAGPSGSYPDALTTAIALALSSASFRTRFSRLMRMLRSRSDHFSKTPAKISPRNLENLATTIFASGVAETQTTRLSSRSRRVSTSPRRRKRCTAVVMEPLVSPTCRPSPFTGRAPLRANRSRITKSFAHSPSGTRSLRSISLSACSARAIARRSRNSSRQSLSPKTAIASASAAA